MKFNPAFLLLAAIVPVVTGSRNASYASFGVSTACGLITRQEAAAALGAPVPAGSEKIADFPLGQRSIKTKYCFFGTEVSIWRLELGPTASTLFTQYRQSLVSKDDYQTIRGIGDGAFHAKGQIAVLKGQTGLIIDVGQARGGGAKELNAEKGLALLAIGRM
ncbi:MAG: hypothetical protein ABIQ55_07655 [Gemmatimonadaceae bacterium]